MNYKRQHLYYLITRLATNIKDIIVVVLALSFLNLSEGGIFIIYGVIVITIGILFLNFIAWRKEVYKIEENTLYLKKGIFIVKDITIPFNKVQSVDIASSFLQDIFKVCKLEVESAGGSIGKKDFSIIISKDEALNLKRYILKGEFIEKEEKLSNYSINIKDILIASLTSTQITIGFSIILGAYTFLFDDIPKKYRDIIVNKADSILAQYTNNDIVYKIIFTTVVLTLIAFIISFGGMILKYYNFKLIRKNKSLIINYGLLSKKEVTMPVNKILYIDIKEGLVRKIFGLCEVKIESIGYGNEKGEKAILCPLIRKKEFEKLLKSILPEIEGDYKIQGIAKKSYKTYFALYILPIIIISILVSIFVPYGYLINIILIFNIYITVLSCKENGLDYNERFLYVRKRNIALHTIIIPKSKVQAISRKYNFISNKNKIANIVIYHQNVEVGETQFIRGMDKSIVDNLIKWYK